LNLSYSIIIPVYNRPQEIRELLKSLSIQIYSNSFEIIIIDDGSTIKSNEVIKEFQAQLDIVYHYKTNSGPGQSRNKGMEIAKGNYFIILDSDVILPKNYLSIIDKALNKNYTDAFGAPDKAHDSFTAIQKSINYVMTAFLTTGGLRTNKGRQVFQLRSFNMGLSKKAFQKLKGFSKQYFGEDIDVTFRFNALDLKKQFIAEAFVYHKRRTNWNQFYKQTFNFGAARPILNKQHKNTSKITYWFPSVFIIGLLCATFLMGFDCHLLIYLYLIYLISVFGHSLILNKNIKVAFLTIVAVIVQFFGYGLGFMRSIFRLKVQGKTIKEAFPKMFF
jgi:glycosyltransferase involved in cell wall biosynthesis